MLFMKTYTITITGLTNYDYSLFCKVLDVPNQTIQPTPHCWI